MTIDRLHHADIASFLAMAAREGWISDQREMEFLLDAFPAGCFAARVEEEAVGFVTAIAYGSSGWIGNLLVRGDRRGNGIGPHLFSRAMEALTAAGTRTIWLTASPVGRPIYEKAGFVALCGVERWRGEARRGSVAGPRDAASQEMFALDEAGWGDRRACLLTQVVRKDRVLTESEGFIAMRRYPDFVQLGPWGAASEATARRLLARALTEAGAGCRVVADVPDVNIAAARLLREHGFSVAGTTDLMYAGERPGGDLKIVYSLASLGSIG